MKKDCRTCSNHVSDTYCTMHKDMEQAKYKQCDGYKLILKPVKKKAVISKEYLSKREERLEAKIDLGSSFRKFLKDGGFWSFK